MIQVLKKNVDCIQMNIFSYLFFHINPRLKIKLIKNKF